MKQLFRLSPLVTTLPLIVVVACSPKNGGRGSNAQSIGTGPELAKISSGQFTFERVLAPDDTSRFDQGCVQKGNSESLSQVDKRLQDVEFFSIAHHQLNTSQVEGEVQETFDEVVTSVTESSVSFDRKNHRTAVNTTVTVISDAENRTQVMCEMPRQEVIVAHGETNRKEILGEDAGVLECRRVSSDVGGLLENATSPREFSRCFLHEDGREEKSVSLAEGRFNFLRESLDSSNQSLRAYQIQQVIQGRLVCDGIEAGIGTLTIERIVSNQVPSRSTSNFCGGADIVRRQVLQAEDGRVLSKEYMEILGISKKSDLVDPTDE